ncbi:Ig-like domain-containing protein [Massilia sp. CCM 9210]|uniref:Ig-like domain-containing protein n=1 Tax=Massilia scottii TaxID=3057166 RepID=UPI0027966250|nr:Ig-like domain-containing protein [Massilia sp. CCM 9210]MDQ1815390.1 Ig-like domain-containing protein [Massilia sp. CCM 9210]
MPKLSDLDTVLSGLNHIDSLLGGGPDWNFLTPVGNTIRYTFSIASNNEHDNHAGTGLLAFSAGQQAGTRAAMATLSAITGIVFVETADGNVADVHLASKDLGGGTAGLASWGSGHSYSGDELLSFSAEAYVYLDDVAAAAPENANLAPGSGGLEILLHELGHMMGLKHPFDGNIRLPGAEDNTSNTLLSYTGQGGPYSNFSPYDIAALKWLYGGDGLRGALGINSTGGGRYFTGTNRADSLTGTAANDRLEGGGGDDALNGGNGTDTAVFRGNYASYTVTNLGGGKVRVSGADGTDTLTSVEVLKFDDQSVQSPQVLTPPPVVTPPPVTPPVTPPPVAPPVLTPPAGDTSAPGAPTLTVSKNPNGYVAGDKPVVSGSAEANATVKVYSGATLVATTTAGANGAWSVATSALADGMNVSLTARATDAANNVSAPSAALQFNVDTKAPAVPSASVLVAASGSVQFSGTGEVGSTIRLSNADAIIAEGTVAADGRWSLGGSTLANGKYDVTVSSLDKAGNATAAAKHLLFTLGPTDVTVVTGTAGDDSLLSTPGNDLIDGAGGTDTVSFPGLRGNYHVVRDTSGFVVTARSGAGGMDLLRNVESIKFGDTTLKLEYDDVVQALYLAYFGRAADSGGLAAFQSQLGGLKAPLTFSAVTAAYASDAGLHSLIDSFGSSAESAALYPGATSAFVTAVFQNILGRAPAAAGLSFWTNAIDNAGLSRANASLSIMAGALENTSTQGLLDAKLVNNKITIASDFTLAIDNPAEVSGYVGIKAAAAVRGMLASVTASTDIAAFQAIIAKTLASLPGIGAQTGSAKMPFDTVQLDTGLPDTPVALVGLQHGGLIDAVM